MSEQWARSHLLGKHLRKPAFSCTRCDYVSYVWVPGQGISPHVVKHGLQRSQANLGFTDLRPTVLEEVLKLQRECFNIISSK